MWLFLSVQDLPVHKSNAACLLYVVINFEFLNKI
jgi:hypothetical protein